jgi:hypothetical protein
LTQATAGNRPIWRGDGWHRFGLYTANRWYELASSESLFNSFHCDGTGHILFGFKRDAIMATTNTLLSNQNISAGQVGIVVLMGSTHKLQFRIYAGGGIALQIESNVETGLGTEHTCEIIIKPEANQSSISVDGEAPVTGTVGTLEAAATPASSILRLGVRSATTLPGNGQLRSLLICSQQLSAGDVTKWENHYLGVSSVTPGKRFRLGVGIGL